MTSFVISLINDPPKYIKIESIFTKPTNLRSSLNKKKQTFGIGTAQIRYVERLSHTQSLKGVVLHPLPSAISFYEKLNYENKRLYGFNVMVKTAEKISQELISLLPAA